MKLKKNPKANLENFSSVFTLIGLVLTLFITYVFIEHKTYAMVKPDMVFTQKTSIIEESPKTVIYRVEKPKTITKPILEETKEPTKQIVKKMIDPNIIKKVTNEEKTPETITLSTDTNTPNNTNTGFENVDYDEIPEEALPETIHYMSVENTPVYPGCEKYKFDKEKSKKCFSSKIAKFFQKKFDTDIASQLNLSGVQSINCQFIIDAKGNISPDIKTSSKTHPALANEVKNVLNKLPKMQPAKQNGKPVNLIYSLPFKFRVE